RLDSASVGTARDPKIHHFTRSYPLIGQKKMGLYTKAIEKINKKSFRKIREKRYFAGDKSELCGRCCFRAQRAGS
ncbi:MAG: hypothetical protein NTX30_06515, partial [Deltaproteobacteria bacterium]|nr:hypothetical protein [Deltaproteobacteria bacterium]